MRKAPAVLAAALAVPLAFAPVLAVADDSVDVGFGEDEGFGVSEDVYDSDQRVWDGDDAVSGLTFNIAGGNVYTGSAITPKVTDVMLDGTPLTAGVDYAVSYQNNVLPGTASATVSPAAGRSFAAKTLYFTIGRLPLSAAKVVLSGAGIAYGSDGVASTAYDGTAKKPSVTVTCNGIKLKQDSDYTVSYSNNVSVGMATVTVTATSSGVCSGHASATFSIVAGASSHDDGSTQPDSSSHKGSSDSGKGETVERVTLTRLYNKWSGEHFYTSDTTEIARLVGLGWNNEGTAWSVPSKSSTPVYRLYNPYTGDHHFTTSKAEYEKCRDQGWKQEGIAWYSADSSGGVPIYRGYNRYVSVGTHHYTASEAEIQTMVRNGWSREGVAWYGLK